MASPNGLIEGEERPTKAMAAEYDANVALLQFGKLMVSSAEPTVNSEPTGGPSAEQASRNEVCPPFSENRARTGSKESSGRTQKEGNDLEGELQSRYIILCCAVLL